MAELSSSLANSIPLAFQYARPATNIRYQGRNWNDNNICRRFISCDLTKDSVEIPIIMRPWVERHIANNSHLEDLVNKRIVMNLIEDSYHYERRAADSILRAIFETDPSVGLLKIVTNKGAIYYGNTGVILDSSFRPLFLATLVGNYIEGESRPILVYNEYRFYIHPDVLINTSDLICKALLKKILLYLINNIDTIQLYSTRSIHRSTKFKVKVIVEDRSDFFSVPILPVHFSNADINARLESRVKDIFNRVKLA